MLPDSRLLLNVKSQLTIKKAGGGKLLPTDDETRSSLLKDNLHFGALLGSASSVFHYQMTQHA